MPARDVAELVRRDDADLAVREAEDRVPEDDAPARAEADRERVCARRLLVHVLHTHGRALGAGRVLQRAHVGAQRSLPHLVLVEHEVGAHEREERDERHEDRAGADPPEPPEPDGERDDDGRDKGKEERLRDQRSPGVADDVGVPDA